MQSKYYKTSLELIILYDEVLVEGFFCFIWHFYWVSAYQIMNSSLFQIFVLASVLIENMFHKNDVNWI